MTELLSLWLPIVVSGVALFFLSFLMWAILPHHAKDVGFHPRQDELASHINESGLKPGMYMFPNCADKKDYGSDEHKASVEKGPWGTLSVWPSKPNMGRNMALTVAYMLFASILVAYVASTARPPGASFLSVFQIATTASAMIFVVGGWLNNIWFGKRLRFVITDAIDGLVYSVVAGLIFALLWPGG